MATTQNDSGFSSATSGVVDSAKGTATQAKEAASRLMDRAKEEAAAHADHQREHVASGIHSVAHAFRDMGDNLRSQNEGIMAEYAARAGSLAADQVEKVASYLRERDIRDIVADTETFARRSPAVFLGGAFALGLAVGRFLRSTPPAMDLYASMPDPSHALPAGSSEGRFRAASDAGYATVRRGDTLTSMPDIEASGEIL